MAFNMIFDKYINFSYDYNENVSIYTLAGTLIGNGRLKFGAGKVPQLTYDYSQPIYRFKNQKTLTCKSEGDTYHLLGCDFKALSVIPKLIIKGDTRRRVFKKLQLKIKELSSWLNSSSNFIFDDGVLTKNLTNKTFNTTIIINKKNTIIGSEHWLETSSSNSISKIHEYTILTLESCRHGWTHDELIELINSIEVFFSLMLGHSLELEHIIDCTNKTTQSIYYMKGLAKERKELDADQYFTDANYLFENGRWQELLQGFFSEESKSYHKVWARMTGMFTYEGFWEYEILAYVSLLDRYVSIISKPHENSVSRRTFSSYKKKIISTIDSIKEKCIPEADIIKTKELAILNSIRNQINEVIKNSDISSFDEKLKLAISKSNPSIIKILRITNETLGDLKRLRNKIAHGDEPQLKHKNNITYEIVITNRIALLLRYWAYLQIGFTHKEFISLLRNWRHPIIQNAYLDHKLVNLELDDTLKFNVNKTNLERVSISKKQILVFNYIKSSQSLRLNKSLTDKIDRVFLSTKTNHKSVESFLSSIVAPNTTKSITYVSKLYLIHNEQSVEVDFGACILNISEEQHTPESLDRIIYFDSEINKWSQSKLESRILGIR